MKNKKRTWGIILIVYPIPLLVLTLAGFTVLGAIIRNVVSSGSSGSQAATVAANVANMLLGVMGIFSVVSIFIAIPLGVIFVLTSGRKKAVERSEPIQMAEGGGPPSEQAPTQEQVPPQPPQTS